MLPRWSCVGLLAVVTAVGGVRAGDAERELADHQGEWRLESHTTNGARMSEERASRWAVTIRKNLFAIDIGDGAGQHLLVRLSMVSLHYPEVAGIRLAAKSLLR